MFALERLICPDLTKIEGIITGVFQCCTLHVHLLSQVTLIAQYKVAYVIE